MQQYGYGEFLRSEVAIDARARFITRTYHHLFGALVAFALVEVALFELGIAPVLAGAMAGRAWLLVLGAFMLTSWLATHVAHTARSLGAQYAALAGYVVVEAVIFVPLLYAANRFAPGVISSAALVSFAGFSALTAIAFYTRKDFSFLRGILLWAGFGALALIVAGALFGFQLGTFFSVAMVVFAGAAILYDTSNIIHRFPEDRHVAAALSLFASVALLFWYVLRLFLSSRD
ncbi:MAG TPA: Bax inhibitor-1 family protein [Polyangiaceae bacterium]|jgi:FtsH-binding integral membrane protein|nr:Bax inhibitor-1 family protein [Polyangiaceae bacterium]